MTPTYTIYVPALGLVKIADCSADTITVFLSNRIETSRYTVIGTDSSTMTGSEWLLAQADAATVVAA